MLRFPAGLPLLLYDRLSAGKTDLNNADTTYNIGPSIAMEITPDLAAGVSLHYHFRTSERNVNQFIYDASQYYWFNTYLLLKDFDKNLS